MKEYTSSEELEHASREAMEAQQAEESKEPYVERPKSQRILAWVLLGAVIVGVLLYYFWISKGGFL